jgi:hypothetical protein
MTEQAMARTEEVRKGEALRKLNGSGSYVTQAERTQAEAEVGIQDGGAVAELAQPF